MDNHSIVNTFLDSIPFNQYQRNAILASVGDNNITIDAERFSGATTAAAACAISVALAKPDQVIFLVGRSSDTLISAVSHLIDTHNIKLLHTITEANVWKSSRSPLKQLLINATISITNKSINLDNGSVIRLLTYNSQRFENSLRGVSINCLISDCQYTISESMLASISRRTKFISIVQKFLPIPVQYQTMLALPTLDLQRG